MLESAAKPVIGWTCTYLPLEILEAGGFQPLRIIPSPSSEKADSYLDPNFCPFIKSLLGEALRKRYAPLSGMVLLNTCDGMRRLYDSLRFYCPPPFCYLLDVPRLESTAAVSYYRDKLREFSNAMCAHFGVEIDSKRIDEAIQRSNTTRELLGRTRPLMGKAEFLSLIAQGWQLPRASFHEMIEDFMGERGAQTRSGKERRPRVLLSGSLIEGSYLVNCVEELGGEVVFADLCIGDRIADVIPTDYHDPFEALSEAYLKKPACARMWATEKRMNHLKSIIEKESVEAVIYQEMKFCDPYLYEAPALKDMLHSMRIPFLPLEIEYSGRADGRTTTRIQAFLEMLDVA